MLFGQIFTIKIVANDFGPTANLLALSYSPGGKLAQQNSVSQLRVPWRDIAEQPNTSSFLSWHTAMSEFAGRDKELEELTAWAEDNRAVSARFIIGEGGTGKSRLGAEFAEVLKKKRWEAGFLNIRTPQNIPMSKKGTLLIVDYPEEHHAHVRELLVALTELDKSQKIRVLFLTRASWSEWEMRIGDCNAYDVVDLRPVHLGRLEGAVAHTLYTSTLEKVSDIEKTDPPPLSEAALNDWLNLAPENDRALFIIAAAVHSALNPDDEVVQYTGSKVMLSLVDRERFRMRRQAKASNEADQDAYCRLLTMTTIAGDVDIDQVVSWASNEELRIGIEYPVQIQKNLEEALLMRKGVLPAPGPDLFAAAFTWTILGATPKTAPDLVWAAIEPDVESGLERLGRLCHDIEYTLGVHGQKLGDWLKEAVDGRPERCNQLRSSLAEVTLPMGLLETAVCVWRTLLSDIKFHEERAKLWNILSIHEEALGHFQEALEAIRQAIKCYHELSEHVSTKFLPNLAASMNNLTLILFSLGQTNNALHSIKGAIEIQRKLVIVNPTKYYTDLASSLSNLAMLLDRTGDMKGALQAIQETVKIRRELASINPEYFLPKLAISLNNLIVGLCKTGDTRNAFRVAEETIVIQRKLAKKNPELHLPVLAITLINMSNQLYQSGDLKRALQKVREAVEIQRKLADANPTRFLPELSYSLNNLSNLLSKQNETEGSLTAIQEAVSIRRRLASENPKRYLPELAASLTNLTSVLFSYGDKNGAVQAIKEAVVIQQQLSDANPGSHITNLAASFNNLSVSLLKIEDVIGALSAAQEAVKLYQKMATANPEYFLPDLARSYGQLGAVLRSQGMLEEALKTYNAGAEIIKPFAEKYPESPHDRLYQQFLREIERTKEMLE